MNTFVSGPRATAGLFFAALLGMGAVWVFCGKPSEPRSTGKSGLSLREGLPPNQHLTAHIDEADLGKCLVMYMELTGRKLWPITNGVASELNDLTGGRLSRWKWFTPPPQPDAGIAYHADGALDAAEAKARLEAALARANLQPVPLGRSYFRLRYTPSPNKFASRAASLRRATE